jgi:hypothetical protein
MAGRSGNAMNTCIGFNRKHIITYQLMEVLMMHGISRSAIRFITLCAATGASMNLFCSLPAHHLIVDGKGPIALVSFSLDRTLKADTDSTLDQGPALLASKPEKETYWDHHQQAADAMYAQFKARISGTLAGAPILDSRQVEGNERYLARTQHVPKMVMGADVALGWSEIPATGTNWVSAYDKPLLDTLCAILGVNCILTVQNKARYHVTDSFRIDSTWNETHTGFSARRIRQGHILLDCSVFLHEKGKGMTWARTYRGLMPKTMADLDGDDNYFAPSYFAPQLTDALEGVYAEISADEKRGRAYAAGQTAKQK